MQVIIPRREWRKLGRHSDPTGVWQKTKVKEGQWQSVVRRRCLQQLAIMRMDSLLRELDTFRLQYVQWKTTYCLINQFPGIILLSFFFIIIPIIYAFVKDNLLQCIWLHISYWQCPNGNVMTVSGTQIHQSFSNTWSSHITIKCPHDVPLPPPGRAVQQVKRLNCGKLPSGHQPSQNYSMASFSSTQSTKILLSLNAPTQGTLPSIIVFCIFCAFRTL